MLRLRSRRFNLITVIFVLAGSVMSIYGQTVAPSAAAAHNTVPELINFSGVLKDIEGKPVNSLSGVTFLLYKDEEGGAPLWLETQNVQPDRSGHYTVTLGFTKTEGVPADLFASGEARWLAVQVSGEAERSRILLVAVPYAMKAKDAETIGGLPPSAFVLASSMNGGIATVSPENNALPTASPSSSSTSTNPNVTTSGGAASAFPIFTTATDIENSIMTQTGSTAVNVGGKLIHPATGTATSTGGKNSQPEDWITSSFNSGTAAGVNQTFRLQAEPAGNNTATPSGTLDLLFGIGTAAPVETGLKISNKGIISFASGQTFPGASSVTSVGLSAPASDFRVTGSPITKSGTLNLAWTVAPTNVNTANAIVKRDATGGFNATNINASGQITVDNGTSLNPINVTATAANAAAIVGGSKGTGLTDGVLGASFSSGQGSAGVIGIDQNSNGVSGHYTTGVTGVTTNAFGVGVLGLGTWSANAQGGIGHYRAGMWGDDATGVGVVATSDTGSGLIALNASTTSVTLNAVNNSTASAVVAANTSNTSATMLAQNNTSAGNGVIFKASAPNVQSNNSPAFCQVTTHGDMGCTGDVYQNLPANGLVKALVYVDPGKPGDSAIVQCFNSTLPEPIASTPPCGFHFNYQVLGQHQIDFGFPASTRFIQGTAVAGWGDTVALVLKGFDTNSKLGVGTFYPDNRGDWTDAFFYLTVF